MSEDAKAAVIALEKQRTAATVAVDIAALSAIYADDLVYVHSSGKADNKAAVLAQLEQMRHIVGLERGDLCVQAWDNAAMMAGPIHYRFRRPDGTERPMSAFATQVFRREGATWRLVPFQATTLA
jgi:ketosteroid isomerase-like protein